MTALEAMQDAIENALRAADRYPGSIEISVGRSVEDHTSPETGYRSLAPGACCRIEIRALERGTSPVPEMLESMIEHARELVESWTRHARGPDGDGDPVFSIEVAPRAWTFTIQPRRISLRDIGFLN